MRDYENFENEREEFVAEFEERCGCPEPQIFEDCDRIICCRGFYEIPLGFEQRGIDRPQLCINTDGVEVVVEPIEVPVEPIPVPNSCGPKPVMGCTTTVNQVKLTGVIRYLTSLPGVFSEDAPPMCTDCNERCSICDVDAVAVNNIVGYTCRNVEDLDPNDFIASCDIQTIGEKEVCGKQVIMYKIVICLKLYSGGCCR